MKYALVNNERQEAQPKVLGKCISCGSDIIARCGNIRVHLSAEQSLVLMKISLEMFIINDQSNSPIEIDMTINEAQVLLHQLAINPATKERNELIWQLWLTSIKDVIKDDQDQDLISVSQLPNIAKIFLQKYRNLWCNR